MKRTRQIGGRDEKGHFLPGCSPNPKGRPPAKLCIPDILKTISQETVVTTKFGKINKLEAVLRVVFDYAVKGKPWAVQFIAERTEGKALERIQQDGTVRFEWQSLSDTPRTLGNKDYTIALPDSE